jgi:hypothetical protein
VVVIPELEDAESEAMALQGDLSAEARKRRVELRKRIDGLKIWDVDRQIIFTEIATLVLSKFAKGKVGKMSTDEVIEVLKNSLNLVVSGSAGSTGFDLYPSDYAWSKAFYLPEDEVRQICEAEGAEKQWLVDNWGLRVHHLGDRLIRKYIIPTIIWEYLWQKYSSKNIKISDEVLEGAWYELRVGLR